MATNRTIAEVHILQTMPPSNLNRDDTGSPKKAVYGGVTRARVSSQAWKRPTRLKFRELVDPNQLGIRTKRVVEVLNKHIIDRMPDTDPQLSAEVAKSILLVALKGKKSKKKDSEILVKPRTSKDSGQNDDLEQSTYLLFLGSHQYDELAEIAVNAIASGDPTAFIKSSDVKKHIKAIAQNDRAIDVRHQRAAGRFRFGLFHRRGRCQAGQR